MADESPDPSAESPESNQAGAVGKVRHRAVLLSIWKLNPDTGVRHAIEVELYGRSDPQRAREEAERLAGLA